ncbi:conserved protein of unknown function (plasmid) [Rhodovastum atsumiense]|nr:conserved protein of unknown function [Rhodovastum atsumiense]
MNRHQRRAATAQNRQQPGRTDLIGLSLDILANVAAPTATGATLILPSGGSLYLPAETARAWCGKSVGAGTAHAEGTMR